MVIVTLASNSFEHDPGGIGLDSNYEWNVRSHQIELANGRSIADEQKPKLIVIVKGSRVAFYINKVPIAYIDDPILLDDKKNERLFKCIGTCYFDHVKIWNLDLIPNLP